MVNDKYVRERIHEGDIFGETVTPPFKRNFCNVCRIYVVGQNSQKYLFIISYHASLPIVDGQQLCLLSLYRQSNQRCV